MFLQPYLGGCDSMNFKWMLGGGNPTGDSSEIFLVLAVPDLFKGGGLFDSI